MQTTSTTHIKSFNKGQSYKGLKANHFEINDRDKKGISKDKNLEKLNKHFLFIRPKWVEDQYEIYEKKIEDFNNKPSQIKNKSRRHKNLADYVEKRRNNDRVTKEFHGLEYMVNPKLGSMESWQEVVKQFEDHGVNEAETLNCLNGAFHKFCLEFNGQELNDSGGIKSKSDKKFRKVGLRILEADTNLDEKGAPHLHCRLFLTRELKNGLPDTNLASALKAYYGNFSNRELMEKFRFDLDNSLVELSSESLKNLAHEKGFEFEGLELIRLESEEKGLTHEAYKERQESKRRKAELDSREEQIRIKEEAQRIKDEQQNQRDKDLDDREIKVTSREKNVTVREDAVASSEASLDERDIEVSRREEEQRTSQNRANKAIKDKEDELDALESERKDKQKELDALKSEIADLESHKNEMFEDAQILDEGFVKFLKGKFQNPNDKDFVDKAAKDYKERQVRQNVILQQGEDHKKEYDESRRGDRYNPFFGK